MDSQEPKTLDEKIKFVDEINNLIWGQRGMADFDREGLIKKASQIAEEIDYKIGKAKCLLNAGMGIFIKKNDGRLSIEMMNEALDIFKKLDNKKWIANEHATLGIIHSSLGNPEPALYNALKGLDFYISNPEVDVDRIMIYYVIGTVYKDLGKFEEAEKNYLFGVNCIEIGNSNWGGRIYTGLAGVYIHQKKFNEALTVCFKALEILKKENNNIGESRAYTDIGVIYKKLNNYDESLNYLNQGLKIREKHPLKPFIDKSYMELASLHTENNKYDEAIDYLSKAEKIAIEIAQLPKQATIYKELYLIYKSRSDFAKALHYSEKLLTLRNDLNKKETDTRLNNLQVTLVKEKEDEIERIKNVELKNANILISEKQKEILDSIHYAKRIQSSLLPTDIYIEKCMNRLKK